MNIVETDYWCLMLPPEWSAEREDDVVLITDQDGIGELAISTLIFENAASSVASGDIARDESPEVTAWESATFGHFTGVVGRLREDAAVITEWYLAHRNALLYCTYACDEEDDGMDAAAVEEILATLVPGDALFEA